MNASAVLKAASDAGVHIAVDKGDLVLVADMPPPDGIIEALLCNKADIIAMLKPAMAEQFNGDWQAFFLSRTAIAEYFEGLSPAEAQLKAFNWCIIAWLNYHSEASASDQCAWCKQPDQPTHVVVPFGTNLHGHTWLHHGCWNAWQEYRRGKAVQALRARGILEPSREPQEPMVQCPP